MELYLVRTDPVQQIAAEPATLELFTTALEEATKPRLATPELITDYRGGLGWPLVRDDSIRPGFVHFRPFPKPAPASIDEPKEH